MESHGSSKVSASGSPGSTPIITKGPVLQKRTADWMILATAVVVVIVVMVFGRLAYGLILQPMRDGLGLTLTQAGNLGTITALGYLSLVLFAGMAAARWGGRFAVLLGLGFAIAGFIGLSLTPGYVLALVFMALLGLGTAFGFTPLISLVSAWFPERQGAAIGVLGSGIGIGILLIGWLIPYLIGLFGEAGWRLSWGVFALGGILTFGCAWLFLPNPRATAATSGVVDKAAVYRSRSVLIVGLIYGLVGIIYISQAVFMYSFALASGLTPIMAGRLTSFMGILFIFSGPCWGWFSDRYGRRLSLMLSLSLTLVGIAIPVAWPTLPSFAVHYLIMGATLNGVLISILAASTECVSAREAPLAVSYVTVFFAVGQLIGPAATGALIESLGFREAFGVMCLIMLPGIVLSFRIGSRPGAAGASAHTH